MQSLRCFRIEGYQILDEVQSVYTQKRSIG